MQSVYSPATLTDDVNTHMYSSFARFLCKYTLVSMSLETYQMCAHNYSTRVFLLLLLCSTLLFLLESHYWPSCSTVTNLEIKHTVKLMFFSPYPLKLPIYEEEWDTSQCLPIAVLLLIFFYFSPHIPLPVSLCAPGASGKGIPELRPLQSVHWR